MNTIQRIMTVVILGLSLLATGCGSGGSSTQAAVETEVPTQGTSTPTGHIFLSMGILPVSKPENGIYDLLLDTDLPAIQVISIPGTFILDYSVSPDGKTIIYIQDGPGGNPHARELHWITIDGTESGLIPAGVGWYTNISWCPDGVCLTVLVMGEDSYHRLYKTDLVGTTLELMSGDLPIDNPMGLPGMYAWSPDGSSIAYNSSGINLMDSNGRFLRTLFEDDFGNSDPLRPDGIRDMAWSPDGSRLAYIASQEFGGPRGIYLYDMQAKLITELMPASSSSIEFLDWSPDGEWLVVTTHSNDVGGVYFIDLALCLQSPAECGNFLTQGGYVENMSFGKPEWRE